MRDKRLPDAEFTVMKAVWNLEPPITTSKITDYIADISWKPQTLLTLLSRLTEKGFLVSNKVGKERIYEALISENEYLEVETGSFLKRYAGNSIGNLVKTLYSEGDLTSEDIDELKQWLDTRK